ncbi:putative mitochondrial import inner membrane translocase subunit TIM50 [Trypanosoma cruzi]|nr:putative mitochondrial import inner membrane translocase subunit TIM50 [Trypanosoma cruzi]
MSQDAASFFRGVSAKISAANQSYISRRARRRVEEEEEEDEPQQPIASPSLSTLLSTPQTSSAPCVATSVVGRVSKTAMTTNVASNTFTIGRSSSKLVSSVVKDEHGDGGGGDFSEISMQSEQVSSTLMTQVRQIPRSSRRESLSLTGNIFLHTGRESATGTNGASSGGDGSVSDKNENGANNNSNNINNNSNNNNNNNNTGSSSSIVSGGGNSGDTEVRPKVHLSALLIRTRRIQQMPKNTSPIVAKNHASLLPLQMRQYHGKKTLILDLDETLVHSSLTLQPKQHDLILSMKTEPEVTTIYVAYRPFLHEFIQAVAGLFEVVIFTASVSMYCNPVMDAVDPEGILGSLRLYREHCSILNGAYVKDLSLLGRELSQVAIVDNSPVTYLFQQRNAIPIPSWFDDPKDNELKRLIPVLEALAQAAEVYDVLDRYNAVLQLQQEQMRPENKFARR